MAEKYFHEAGNGHYDVRYYRGSLPLAERKRILVEALATFTRLTERLGIRIILMHGALIGWYWNRKLLPWDNDIDVCLLSEDFDVLADFARTSTTGGRHMLDINPNFPIRTSLNKSHWGQSEPNRIDARFIDRNTGLYLDITILKEVNQGILSTKCPHHYKCSDILPLGTGIFEALNVWLPNSVENVLTQEYGSKSISDPVFRSWVFDPLALEWRTAR